jgi:Zn-dependent M28 family amino/carboxypeptidase
VRYRVSRVRADIERLAGDIGPREATSEAYRRAARLVRQRFSDLGYRTTTQRVRVPAGNSWGTRVPAGTSQNVIATRPGFRPRQPHIVLGAHLDTVPVAPGAEDNASGVAMMLELARLVAAEPPDRPIKFIAFGAEEPRGTGDDLHHFGSQQLVAGLGPAERQAITAMVALDRVGVRHPTVPVCSTPQGSRGLRAELRTIGRQVGIPTHRCTDTASDHWSYAKAGVRAARIGSVPYAGYHSPADTPEVISPQQLRRGGRLVWAWLRRS